MHWDQLIKPPEWILKCFLNNPLIRKQPFCAYIRVLTRLVFVAFYYRNGNEMKLKQQKKAYNNDHFTLQIIVNAMQSSSHDQSCCYCKFIDCGILSFSFVLSGTLSFIFTLILCCFVCDKVSSLIPNSMNCKIKGMRDNTKRQRNEASQLNAVLSIFFLLPLLHFVF